MTGFAGLSTKHRTHTVDTVASSLDFLYVYAVKQNVCSFYGRSFNGPFPFTG